MRRRILQGDTQFRHNRGKVFVAVLIDVQLSYLVLAYPPTPHWPKHGEKHRHTLISHHVHTLDKVAHISFIMSQAASHMSFSLLFVLEELGLISHCGRTVLRTQAISRWKVF